MTVQTKSSVWIIKTKGTRKKRAMDSILDLVTLLEKRIQFCLLISFIVQN